jgi:serine/threonine-protein kinase
VNIYDVGSQDNINYIIMEYVHGKTLKELIIHNGRLDYNRALDIAIQISKAIECAHKNNIIHRDIKPQNILVTEDNNVKVTDFGIAKASNSVTITNTNKVMGSAHYFSPEQAKGTFVDARTDIYSMGVVIYEMVTGRVPFDAESPVSVALKHLQEPVLPPKHLNNNIPEGLNNLILKAMEKEPVGRYQNIKDMLLDLQRIKNNSDYKVELGNQFSEHTKIMTPITNYDKDEEVPIRNKKRIALILIPLIILIMIVGFFTGWFIETSKITDPNANKSSNVVVPTIIGLDEAAAENKLKEFGLKLVVESREKSDMSEGIVFSVKPNEGTSVKANSEVRVIVSSGTDKTGIPNFKDLDVKLAMRMAENSNMKLAPIEYEFSDTVPINIVIKQTPDAGASSDKDTKIVLVVSKGPEVTYTTVPSLIGRSLSEAENLLNSFNLKMGNKTAIETNDKNLDGKVALQKIEPNTQNIKEGTAVDISYYKYTEVEQVAVPDFTGRSFEEAKSISEDLGLKVSASGGKTSGLVSDQQPKAKQQVQKGSTITLTFTDAASPNTIQNGGTNQ